MDMYSLYQKSFKAGRYLLLTIVMLNLFSIAFAQSQIASALKEVCLASQTFLGAAIMIMILLAGATYALGQVLGAETRARASVWATAMMTGAIIGALIYLLTPIIVQALIPTGSGISFTPSTPCGS